MTLVFLRPYLTKPVYFYLFLTVLTLALMTLLAFSSLFLYLIMAMFGFIVLLSLIYKYPFPFTCLWIFFSPLLIIAIPSPEGLPTFYLTQYFFFLLIGIFIIKSILRKEGALSHDITDFSLLMIFPWAIFSTFFNISRMYAIDFEVVKLNGWGLVIVILMMMIYLFFSRQIFNKVQLKWFFGMMFFSGTLVSIMAIYGIVQTGSPADISNRAATDVLPNPGFLGNFIGILIPVVFAFIMYVRKKLYRLILVVIFFLLITGLVLSFSRSAWIGIAVGISFVIFMRSRKWTVLFILVGMSSILLSPTVLNIIENFIRKYYTSEGIWYTNDRLVLWKYALGIIKEHWIIGHGMGGFAYASTTLYLEGDKLGVAHNNYLEMMVETGVFGLSLFLLFLVTSVIHGIRIFLHDTDPFYRTVAVGIVASLLNSMCAMGFQEYLFVNAANGGLRVLLGISYSWILLGLLANIYRQRKPLYVQKEEGSITRKTSLDFPSSAI